MERKSRLYTGTGDRGRTSLFSGERVTKSYARVAAYGDLDELNSALGALISALPEGATFLVEELRGIQSNLLHAGAWLATTPEAPGLKGLREIGQDESRALETAMDRMDARLSPLTAFILPGGHAAACWAHVARTTCRRAERHVVRLSPEYEQTRTSDGLWGVVTYLNRLSDYLFLLARYCNVLVGVPEEIWEK